MAELTAVRRTKGETIERDLGPREPGEGLRLRSQCLWHSVPAWRGVGTAKGRQAWGDRGRAGGECGEPCRSKAE